MRKVKEVLRLRFELGLGQRRIARSCGMGLSTVRDYLERAARAGISSPLAEGLGEVELEAKLFGNQRALARTARSRPEPDWKAVHEQLQQHRHLTLQWLQKYRQSHPQGYRYSWFLHAQSCGRDLLVLGDDLAPVGWKIQATRKIIEGLQSSYRTHLSSVEFIPERWEVGVMKNLLHTLWTENQGQDIAEYAVMLAVILVIVVGTVRLVGSQANNVFSTVASSIQ